MGGRRRTRSKCLNLIPPLMLKNFSKLITSFLLSIRVRVLKRQQRSTLLLYSLTNMLGKKNFFLVFFLLKAFILNRKQCGEHNKVTRKVVVFFFVFLFLFHSISLNLFSECVFAKLEKEVQQRKTY